MIGREEFKKLLHESVVEFTYTKKNGEVREAKGTTKAELLPVVEEAEKQEKHKHTCHNEDRVTYYDLNSNGWRSFLFENLQKITEK